MDNVDLSKNLNTKELEDINTLFHTKLIVANELIK